MTESNRTPMEHFRASVSRAGLEMSSGEMESLKEMYDHYAERIAHLHLLDLGEGDLAIVFPPATGQSPEPEVDE